MTTPTRTSATRLTRERGSLQLDGVDLSELAARFATPCYVYSAGLIESHWHQYVDAIGAAGSIHYSVKANPTGAILQLLARNGAGFDIVSAHEMRRVLAAGGRPSAIVFSGVGKRDEEISAALEAGVGRFNVESLSELRRLDRLARAQVKTASVALRVNPDVTPDTHRHIATGGQSHKFGIDQTQVANAAELTRQLPGLQLDGLAMHIGSQITDLTSLIAATRRLRRLAEELRTAGIPIQELDLGGGLGIGSHAPAINEYVEAMVTAVGKDYQIALEPGRSIVATAGLMLTRVVCLKATGTTRFAVVDAGMNDFLRPALYDARHEIIPVADCDTVKASYQVVGPVCETADTLGRMDDVSIAEGSLLAILDTGAYGATMSSHYNSRPRCSEVMIHAGNAHLIRQPESFDDLVRHEQLLSY